MPLAVTAVSAVVRRPTVMRRLSAVVCRPAMACDSAVGVALQCGVPAVHREVSVNQRAATVFPNVPNPLRQMPHVSAMMQRRAVAHYVVREVPLVL